jgi:flagellar basal-body rod protein FlgF
MQALGVILLSGEEALARSMDVIANNIANANTTGFKREGVAFSTYLTNRPNALTAPLQLAVDKASYRDISNGPIQKTGNELDLAISGKGYFQVQKADGSFAYTRAGSFQLNSAGELVTHSGEKVMGDGGQALSLPENVSEVNVSSDGYVTARTGTGPDLSQLGKISVVKFDHEQSLQMLGGGLYTTSEAPQTANGESTTGIVQGAVEDSNVNPVVELTTMIQISRSYQQTMNIISSDRDRNQQALDKLSKTS